MLGMCLKFLCNYNKFRSGYIAVHFQNTWKRKDKDKNSNKGEFIAKKNPNNFI